MPVKKTRKGHCWKIENTPGFSKTEREAEKRLAAMKASSQHKGRKNRGNR